MKRKPTKAERQHMDRVAQFPCMACGAHPVELHHPRRGMGIGQRASNYDVLPLCADHHRTGGHGVALHAGQKTWEAIYGTEAELLERLRGMM